MAKWKEREKIDINIRLEGIFPSDASVLIKLLNTMRIMGSHGSSRELRLFVDGDGRFGFKKLIVDGQEIKGNSEKYPSRNYDDPEQQEFIFD